MHFNNVVAPTVVVVLTVAEEDGSGVFWVDGLI